MPMDRLDSYSRYAAGIASPYPVDSAIVVETESIRALRSAVLLTTSSTFYRERPRTSPPCLGLMF